MTDLVNEKMISLGWWLSKYVCGLAEVRETETGEGKGNLHHIAHGEMNKGRIIQLRL